MPKLDPTTIPIPDWTTIGELRKQKGSGGRWQQRWRFLDDPPRKVRTTSSGTTNKRTAAKVITQRINAAIRKELTKNDPQVKRALTTLEELIDQYEDSLLAQGNSPKHATQTTNRITRMVNECEWKHADDIDKLQIESWLSKFKVLDSTKQRKVKASAQTRVHFASAIKAFCRWMTTHDKIDKDPFYGMNAKPNGDIPVTFTRRAFTKTEFTKLLKNARASEECFRDLTGTDRALIYEIARETGLRAHELSTITPAGCKLDKAPYLITIDCTISKRRKYDRLEIKQRHATKLKRYINSLQDHDRDEPIWGNSWWRSAKGMLYTDIQGINAETKKGVIDFHSLRHTRVTNVAESGASLMDTMQICRLSSPTLVARYYHPNDEKRTKLIESIE